MSESFLTKIKMPLVSDYVNFKVSDKMTKFLYVFLSVCLSLFHLSVCLFEDLVNATFFYKNVIIVSEML